MYDASPAGESVAAADSQAPAAASKRRAWTAQWSPSWRCQTASAFPATSVVTRGARLWEAASESSRADDSHTPAAAS